MQTKFLRFLSDRRLVHKQNSELYWHKKKILFSILFVTVVGLKNKKIKCALIKFDKYVSLFVWTVCASVM